VADQPFELARFPVHLGLGATAERLAEFDGTPQWYERYAAAHTADGVEGRLVSVHSYDTPWNTWEVHPNGEELVFCIEGTMTLHQEVDGSVVTVTLGPGQAAINPPGTWHTADVDGPCTTVFVTPGTGTVNRPR